MTHRAPDPRSTERPLSPRRRRLRWTATLLLMAAVLGILIGTSVYLKSRPTRYSPDEKSADITSSLLHALPPDAPRPRFTDVTTEAGLASFVSFAGSRSSQLPEDMGGGAAWGDFDNDGDEDLFLVSAGGPLDAPAPQLAASQLFENLGNGRFCPAAEFSDLRIHGMGAAWGDYDNDGYLDLAVSGYNTLLLLHNEQGTGRFTPERSFPELQGFWTGVSWGDYDHDRNLDLYVCGYVQYSLKDADRSRNSSQLGTAVPYTLNPSSYQPLPNLLFRNRGDRTFEEVAGKLGVSNPQGRSLGALWHDFDNDGWVDIYVANDIAGSVFYRNTGGGFEDASAAAWVTDYRSAMGLAAGDYDRDGDDDLFITHWVAQENALFDNRWASSKPATAPSPTSQSPAPASHPSSPAPARLRFMDLNEARGLGQISLPYVGWGTEFVDLDADGWLDLVVANGSTLELDGPPPRKLKPQEPFLLWNQRGELFHNLAPLSPVLSQRHVSRGLAVADYDNDGDLDLLLVHLDAGVQLLRNDMPGGHWLKVCLRSRTPQGGALGFADGAKVLLHLGGTPLRRTVSSVSYLSQSTRILHFGLGKIAQVERLEVHWPGGATNVFVGLQANTAWQLIEGDPTPKRLSPAAPLQTTGTAPVLPAMTHRSLSAQPSGTAWVLPPQSDRNQILQFWKTQRAAMEAMKVENDIPKAIRLFQAALQLNPDHEDSRYYLGNCLARQQDIDGALQQLTELIRISPQSHRGHSQRGILQALSAHSDADLAAAELSLQRAHELNPEETGALLVLGEIAVLRGHWTLAEERLANACQTNPKAVGGFFLRAYIAHRNNQGPLVQDLLTKAREALGKDWQPKGATSEGDVRQRWHTAETPLSRFWEEWNGLPQPKTAFAALEAHLGSGSL